MCNPAIENLIKRAINSLINALAIKASQELQLAVERAADEVEEVIAQLEELDLASDMEDVGCSDEAIPEEDHEMGEEDISSQAPMEQEPEEEKDELLPRLGLQRSERAPWEAPKSHYTI